MKAYLISQVECRMGALTRYETLIFGEWYELKGWSPAYIVEFGEIAVTDIEIKKVVDIHFFIDALNCDNILAINDFTKVCKEVSCKINGIKDAGIHEWEEVLISNGYKMIYKRENKYD